jgi:Carboxypeptidase regulatory-like domain
MSRAAALMAIACAILAPALPAQQASISGRILSDADGRPIARAAVTLSGGAEGPTLVTVVDTSGSFAFTGLPAGLFTLTASKPAYLTMAYGQTTPGRGAGVPVSIAEGQQVAGLTWKLPRGGVISGRVVDAGGRPMRDVPIVLMQYRDVNGRRTLNSVTCCTWPVSDDEGLYRVYGIVPGDYLVSALPPGSYVYIASGPWGSSREIRWIDADEMRWALEQLAAPRAVGGRPPPGLEPPAGQTVAYGRLFYPGALDDADAATLSIGAGEERTGIDVAMRLYPTARLDLTILGPDSQPAVNPRVTMGGATSSNGSATRTFRNLVPGRHTISAVTTNPPLWGSIDVAVNGTDLPDVVLRLQPAPSISGRVVFRSTTLAPPAATTARIALRPLSPASPPVTVGADGTFTMSGVPPNRYRVTAALAAAGRGAGGPGPTGGWVLDSARLSGRDVADVPFDIGPGDSLTDLVVTFTDRVTELSGRLLDAAGRPAPGYYVVVFPTDPAQWAPGSRRSPPPARTATDGRFAFTGLPPGAYYMTALSSVDQVDLDDPGLLKELAASATTVTLSAGEKKAPDFKFGR